MVAGLPLLTSGFNDALPCYVTTLGCYLRLAC